MSFRDIKRNARRDLHDHLQIPAIYIPTAEHAGIEITCRLHTKFDLLALDAGPTGLASRREMKPKIIFMRDEMLTKGITLKRLGVVSIEPGEAFLLENADAPDDITVSFFVTQLSATDAAGLPVPVA